MGHREIGVQDENPIFSASGASNHALMCPQMHPFWNLGGTRSNISKFQVNRVEIAKIRPF